MSPVHAPHAICWLSGKNLPAVKSEQLSLPNSGQADRSGESFDLACQILSLISQYKSVVICFDQLEGTSVTDAGFTKAQVAVNLGMDLYNNISRGLLITAVYPEIWSHQIRVLSSAEAVIDRVGECIVDLKFLNSDDVILLVQQRLASFYATHHIKPPHSLYPFEENVLRDKGKQRATARDILQWCCKNWKGDSPALVEPDVVRHVYEKELASIDIDDFIDDKVKLSRAIGFGFENLIGQTLEDVTLTEVDYKVMPKSSNKGYIDFRIIGIEKSKPVKIGVAIIQYPTGIGVQAGLSRLVDYQKFDLTRGCLLRTRDISPGAKVAIQLKDNLLNNLGGEWPEMKIEDLKPLIAIRSVFDTKDDYDLTEEMIHTFISKTGLVANNSLLLEILSAPSGQTPSNLSDDDSEIILVSADTNSAFGQTDDELDFREVAA